MKSRSSQQGIALVITLIMLAVTLVMAVAFLAISSRERGSVTTSTDSTHAREAADSALAQAEAQIMANIFATTNAYNFGLLVSTNYINYTYGFQPGIINPTNVSYNYTNGDFLNNADDLQQNIANLQILPRAPVFVPLKGGGYDFRYYLDLNRNGQFDPNNQVSNLVYFSAANTFSNLGPVTEVGDPEWIGVLEHPDQPHGPLNKFIARYAFIAVPVGNTLDVNAMYNDATMPDAGSALTMKPLEDGFLRNEGVGTWELNLAAFLADLNTNEWDATLRGGVYDYRTPYGGTANEGAAFDDALSILRYRYAYGLTNQLSVDQDYGNFNGLQFNGIDDYSVGLLMTNNNLPFVTDKFGQPWAGSTTTNRFFSLADFFSPGIFRPQAYSIPSTTPVFPDRLLHAGTNTPVAGNSTIPTYDRYTFYRMLSELGTDSTPDYGKMNLNYVNVDASGNVVPGMETNYLRWNAAQFFTNAADRLLKAYTTNWFQSNPYYFLATFYNSVGNYYYVNSSGATITNDITGLGLTNRPFLGMTNQIPGFGLANIPVLVNGGFVYTPAVQRLLQLAANIYDATTTNFYPSVFRPVFFRTNVTGNVYITGYQAVTNITLGINDPQLAPPLDFSALAYRNLSGPITTNIYGVPWIIGAKKGLPSFNEMNVLNTVQVSRLLQVHRSDTNPSPATIFTTNEMFLMSISNSVGMSLWNSYNSNYYGSGNIEIYMQDQMEMLLTNANNAGRYNPGSLLLTNLYYYANISGWPGSEWTYHPAYQSAPVQAAFYFTNWTIGYLPPSVYSYTYNNFIVLTNPANPVYLTPQITQLWETNVVNNYPFPQFGYMTTNWAQAFVLDGPPGQEHVVDYVQFSGPDRTRNLTAEIADPPYGTGSSLSGSSPMWSTNAYGGSASGVPEWGEVNQILLSRGSGGATAPPGAQWANTSGIQGLAADPATQQAAFAGFWTATWTTGGRTYSRPEYTAQAPYTPTRTMFDYTLWQANDPLVHYLASDLNYTGTNGTGIQKTDTFPPTFNVVGLSLAQLGTRYQPWNLINQMASIADVDQNSTNKAFKDPLVYGSDDWQFPTNLFPSVGWLGRVHRGTPWQTVYLKSTNLLGLASSANGLLTWQIWSGDTGNAFDASNAAPVGDRLLFDLFNTAPNENASMGQLSINQTRLAPWSAVFSGLPVFTNLTGTNAIFPPAGPAGTNSALGYIWSSIQQTRSNTNLFRSEVFGHIGDILATPGLSDASPFLQGFAPSGISENMYEWLPQQTMSLLKVGAPRYVIYCYGQALKPAPNGIVASGPNALMCTNYQIVAESAVRAVVQVENPYTSAPHIVLKNLNPLPPDQ